MGICMGRPAAKETAPASASTPPPEQEPDEQEMVAAIMARRTFGSPEQKRRYISTMYGDPGRTPTPDYVPRPPPPAGREPPR